MKFTKMQGCGNDYVYVDGSKEVVPQNKKPSIVRFLSDRHFGIGSDGVIFINPVDDEEIDFEMEMFNADGTRSEMCGNGIRCVAKYVYDKQLTDKQQLTIVSAGKNKYIDLKIGEDELVESVKVNMGAPILDAASVPVTLTDEQLSKNNIRYESLSGTYGRLAVNVPVEVAGKTWNVTCVSMGNPHCVVFLPEDADLSTFDINTIGPLFENHPMFPNRTNTEFVSIDDMNNVRMRVWERGTGETLACGTGCCATTVACILNLYTATTVNVHVLGGVIKCSWDKRPDSPVIMEGPATTVFDGEIDISKF
ncbi:diaminopimelate epimerase [Butyrivibrio sp. INlla21]|uniref:diaminopimelate epimerase n=1 Tax=Butyrivibrio sp. INlla21 TaxID=1520811 RepID=UPI0008E9A60B|nr:diaminopimelate epimerase [Butyrivibrio sp. INlla21]SFU93036.1 diaminopimelate epimerase [Butyrivibrio sp. INlla21]